jgi:uncharacterized membrane protein
MKDLLNFVPIGYDAYISCRMEVDMQHTEAITINRPQSEVWSLVGDPTGWPEWLPDVADVEIEGPLEQGAALSYTWRTRRVRATVTHYVRGQSLRIHSTENNYEFDEAISLRGLGGMTVVSITMGFKPTVWWASALSVLLWPTKKLMLGRPLRKELNALRAAVEVAAPVRQSG